MKYCPLCECNYDNSVELCELDGATLRVVGVKEDAYLGKVIKGRYNVMSKIGEGGMGTVYLAEQLSIGRKVALKVLQGNYANDDEFITRFRREARLAASLNHRNIVTVYDFDQGNDGSLFIAMEFLRGAKLSDVVRHDGPLEIRRAVRLGLQIAEGLEAAHRAGVIHRDIKPDNIMVVGGPGFEEVKLMDFGIARMMDSGSNTSNLTRTGMIMGTPAYMSPEQAEGAEISEKTDIYALGVVLYEMLTGSVPFKASTPSAVLIKHIREQPAPLRKIRREIPSDIDRLVMQALEKKPQKRLRDMRAVVEGLQKAKGIVLDQPVSSRTVLETFILSKEKPSGARRFGLPLLGGGVAGFLLLGLGLFWYTGVFGGRENSSRKVVSLELAGQREFTIGDKGILTVRGNFSDGSQAPMRENLLWQSSNPSVARVDEQGVLNASGEGVAEISVKHAGAASATFVVAVKFKPAPPGPTVDELVNLARTARDKGDYDSAFDSLRKAKAVDPRNQTLQAEYQQTKSACQAELRSGLTNSRCDA